MQQRIVIKRFVVMVLLAVGGVFVLSYLDNYVPHSLKWNVIWLVGIGAGIVSIFMGMLTAIQIAKEGIYKKDN